MNFADEFLETIEAISDGFAVSISVAGNASEIRMMEIILKFRGDVNKQEFPLQNSIKYIIEKSSIFQLTI
jgi:hypothetical protein